MSELKKAATILKAARSDLRALRGMQEDTESFVDEIFGFHLQQAIEKTLKCWIALRGKEYPFTHDIGRLIGILEREGLDMTKYDDFVEYHPYATVFRYDSTTMKSDEVPDRAAAVREVQELFHHVEQLLKVAQDIQHE
jgi:HEPN domain-containing protein